MVRHAAVQRVSLVAPADCEEDEALTLAAAAAAVRARFGAIAGARRRVITRELSPYTRMTAQWLDMLTTRLFFEPPARHYLLHPRW